jgi:hypothetical protein
MHPVRLSATLVLATVALLAPSPAGAFSQAYAILPGSTLTIGAGSAEEASGSMTLETDCDSIVSGNCSVVGNAQYLITHLLIETDTLRFESSGDFPTLMAPNGNTLDIARALEVENSLMVGGRPVPFVFYGFDPEATGAADTYAIWNLSGAEDAGDPLSRARGGFGTAPFPDQLSLELDVNELIVELTDSGFNFLPGGATGSASIELLVPEPASAALLALGLAVLGASRRSG